MAHSQPLYRHRARQSFNHDQQELTRDLRPMAKLTLVISLKHHKRRTYEMQVTIANPKQNPALNDKSMVFTATSHLHGGKCKVYRGSLTCEGHVFPIDVVCKLVRGSRVAKLAHEANLYNTVLTPAHGEHVPLFLYHAEGNSPYTSLPMAATIMTYAGESLGNSWANATPPIRFKAFLALVRIHQLGLWLNNIEPSNVVVDLEHDLVRVVDFDEAVVHKCAMAPDRRYSLYQISPSSGELGCGELYDHTFEMDIFTEPIVSFCGRHVNMLEIKSPAEMIAWILEEYPHYGQRQAVRDGTRYFNSYQDHYIKRWKDAYVKQQALRAAQANTSQALQCPMAALSLSDALDSVQSDDTPEAPV